MGFISEATDVKRLSVTNKIAPLDKWTIRITAACSALIGFMVSSSISVYLLRTIHANSIRFQIY